VECEVARRASLRGWEATTMTEAQDNVPIDKDAAAPKALPEPPAESGWIGTVGVREYKPNDE
jgi:hypothetical protein